MKSGTDVRAGHEASAASPGAPGAATLQVRGVGKVFESARGSIEAVRDVTFDVPSGKFVALVGPSGCGKSTMLRIICGIYPATAGLVLIGDEPVVGPRRDVGLVFQSPNLLPWRTIAKNVALPLEVGGRSSADAAGRADHFLRMVGLYDFRDKLPQELSGGMQQRAGIVRALVHDPSLLLMDEPFGAVDVLTREKLNFEIQSLWEQTKKTIVFVTHSIAEAVFLSDTVFVFSPRPGTIVKVVDVDLPRPRTRHTMYTQEFEGCTNLVREHVRE
jgi:NitT/TauT family transport system ATP-binding protein